MPVYFIRWAALKGPIKIGWADDPETRLAQIQYMSPVPLVILNTLDCKQEQEGAIHFHFAHLRLYGEWFKPKRELLRFVQNPCQVIDRRSFKVQPDRRRCIGQTGIERLSPCNQYAADDSDYCARCDRMEPKGMPKAHLRWLERRECKGVMWNDAKPKPCYRPATAGSDYCHHCDGLETKGMPKKYLKALARGQIDNPLTVF